MRGGGRGGWAECWRDFAEGQAGDGGAHLFARPEAPTKIAFGLEDRITPARLAQGLSCLIALHRFPRIGHMPHLEAARSSRG